MRPRAWRCAQPTSPGFESRPGGAAEQHPEEVFSYKRQRTSEGKSHSGLLTLVKKKYAFTPGTRRAPG